MSEPIKLLLSLSLSGTILAGIIFLLKPFIKNKISKSIQYYIWLIVLFRLILPFSFESSVMNNLFYGDTQSIEVSSQIDVQPEMITPSEASSIPNVQQNVEMGKYINDVDHSRYLNDSLKQYTIYLWILGIIVTLVFNIFGYLHFSRRLKLSNKEAKIEENDLLEELLNVKYKSLKLKRNSVINTPMLIGIMNPCIVIPDNNYSNTQLRNILSHEITHLKHKDIIVKWVTMIVSAVHWFNPFMYFIKKGINSACELACDETVIKNLSANEKQAYGETLISVVLEQKCPNGMLQATMCEEKKSLKERLVAIMKHKKKSKVIIVLSAILLIGVVAGALFLGAGVGTVEKEPPNLYIGYQGQDTKVAITGTYGWKWPAGGIQSDSIHPIEFDYKQENILTVNPSTRIEIDLKRKNDLSSKNYDYEIIEGLVYKNKKQEIPYKPLPEVIEDKMTIVSPLVEGEYVYSLLINFKNKGMVNYGFSVKVNDSSTKVYRNDYGWIINYPKDWDIIGDNFIRDSKTNKFISFGIIENIPEEKVDGVLNGEIKRIIGASEAENTIKENLKKVEKDELSIYSFSHNSKSESKTTLIKHTYFYDKKNIYMFSGQIPELTEEEYLNTVNSFKIVDEKIQTTNLDILKKLRGDWIEKNRYNEILDKNINNPMLNLSSQYMVQFLIESTETTTSSYQEAVIFNLNFFDTAIGGMVKEFKEIEDRKYLLELENGFQANLEFNESMNECKFSSKGRETLTYLKSAKLDLLFSKFILPGVYVDNNEKKYSFDGNTAKVPKKEFKYEIKVLQGREFFMREIDSEGNEANLYCIRMIEGKMHFYTAKHIPGIGEEVPLIKYMFELRDKNHLGFQMPNVSKKEVEKLSEEGIVGTLFSKYLEYYKQLPEKRKEKLIDYRIDKIEEPEFIPEDMMELGPIYHITFSVKGNLQLWAAGNGREGKDGWFVNKMLFVRLQEDKDSYKLGIMGTGL